MDKNPRRRCYLCGKPCWNKGCRSHLVEGKFASEAKRRNRYNKKKHL